MFQEAYLPTVSGGGSPLISQTFGAALWVLDYSLRAASTNIKRFYFHHGGPLSKSFYRWWSPGVVNSPYYGGYVATLAMAGASFIQPLDAGNSTYGGYVTFSARGKPMRIVLINSDYYDGHGSRLIHDFELRGLGCGSVSATRLTATSAMSRQDYGDAPTFGGSVISNSTCKPKGYLHKEHTFVSEGKASFQLAASEALLIEI